MNGNEQQLSNDPYAFQAIEEVLKESGDPVGTLARYVAIKGSFGPVSLTRLSVEWANNYWHEMREAH